MIKYDFSFSIPQKSKIEKEFGLDIGGRVQKVLDSSFMYFMDKKMPIKNKELINSMYSSTKVGSGMININKIHAHYQNTGIVYVDPVYGFAAIPLSNGKNKEGTKIITGFISRPNIKKISSGKSFKPNKDPNRGPHFVERTINENFNDILYQAQKELEK